MTIFAVSYEGFFKLIILFAFDNNVFSHPIFFCFPSENCTPFYFHKFASLLLLKCFSVFFMHNKLIHVSVLFMSETLRKILSKT